MLSPKTNYDFKVLAFYLSWRFKILPMKNVLLTLILLFTFSFSHAQWTKKLTLPQSELFSFISAVNNNLVWVLNNNKQIYISANAGNNWRKINTSGIAGNTTAKAFFAINERAALLAVNTDFTGIGPGIIYRTNDTGRTWQQVFTHEGNCEFFIDMSTNNAGLMTCSFDSFNGSVKSGQQLFKTLDGGLTWTTNSITDPSNDFRLLGLEVKNKNAWLVDDNSFYFSKDGAVSWLKQPMPLRGSYYNNLQVVNSSYAIINESSLINIFVKRPGSNAWMNIGDPTGFGGALTCMVLDSSECWFATPFDLPQVFYSNDSAKTFTPQVIDNKSAFSIMVKARNGKNLWGAANFSRNLWMLERGNGLISQQSHEADKNNYSVLK